MKKVYLELQKVYKKANKESKLRIAKEWGHTTTESFEAFLAKKLGTTEAKKTTPKKTSKKKDIDTGAKVGDTIKIEIPVPTTSVADVVASVADSKVEAEPINDIVIAFDTTGSMGSYIKAVKDHVETLIPQLFSKMPNLRMEIIAFGDYCDMRNASDFGNAYQKSGFTNNENDLIRFVKGARNTEGGDSAEFYELVIKKITEETPWREGSTRSVLLIADDQPHEVGYSYPRHAFRNHYIVHNSQIDWKKEAQKAAEKGIQFDTLSIHGTAWYRELSRITNGVYAQFSSASKTQEVVKASMLSRGGTEAKKEYMVSRSMAFSSGDTELQGLYKSFDDKL